MPRHEHNPFIGTAASTADADDNTRHGATGSDTRVAMLFYLSTRPAGVLCAELALHVGLDLKDTGRVLRALQKDERVACDRAAQHSRWYIPKVRAEHKADIDCLRITSVRRDTA